jgi:hypothetical protein
MFLVFISGCSGGLFGSGIPSNKGGYVNFTKQTTTTGIIDNIPTTTQTVIKSEVHQPENPEQNGFLNIKDGTLEVNNSTGFSRNINKIKQIAAANGLLNPVILCGLGLVLLGGLSFVFIRDIKLSLPLVVLGGALIILSYLLAAYSIIILICGIVASVIFGGYLFWKYFIHKQAVIENVNLIQEIKKSLPSNTLDNLFYGKNPTVKTIQSIPTQKLVKRIKFQEGL